MERIDESLDAHHGLMESLAARAAEAARGGHWAEYRTLFAELRRALIEHMTYEDEELYPRLARTLGEAEIAALRGQHERLQQHFETLASAAPEHDPEGCLGELDQLASLLREHHERELSVCYPHSDRAGAEAPPRFGDMRSLDLRGLQPPEPIVRIFEALERSPREPLRAILPHEPVPLYGLLRERGFSYSGRARADGGFEVLIEPA